MRQADATARLYAVRASCSPPELADSLDDPSPEVARAAIGRLVELEGPRAAPALRTRLLDADLSLVADIARALKRIGAGGVIEAAIPALSHERYFRRLAAVRVLGAVGDERTAAQLCKALDDDVAGVRAAALEALTQLGHRDCVGVDCARLLSDPVARVRIAAVRSVGRLVTHPGTLLTPAAADQDRLVRLEVAQHVAGLPEHAAKALLADPDIRVREAAARAAGTRELGALSVLLTDDPAPDVRRASAHALAAVRDQRVADLLVPGLEDRDPLVRAAVLRALAGLLTQEGAARRLRIELAGERPQRRRAALYALARLSARAPEPELWGITDDPDPDVRLALIHSAAALCEEPEPLVRQLAADSDPSVRQAAEMWLLRATDPRS